MAKPNTAELEQAIRSALGALPPPSRTRLLQSSLLHAVQGGTVLFEQGGNPTFQYVLLTGCIHLLGRADDGREVLIEVVEAPDLVVPAAVMTGAPYLMRARAPQAARLLLIEAGAFRTAALSEPKLAAQVIDSLSGQFRRLVRQIKSLKLRSTTERAACYVLALSVRQGTPHRAVLPYGKNLIASELGMTRESFSRSLAALAPHGISVQGEAIAIRDPARLANACGADALQDEPLLSAHRPRLRESSRKTRAKRVLS